MDEYPKREYDINHVLNIFQKMYENLEKNNFSLHQFFSIKFQAQSSDLPSESQASGIADSFYATEIYINKAMDVQRPVFAEGYGSLASLARERKDMKSALQFYKLAYKETPSDDMLYFNICTVADQYYKVGLPI